MWRKLALAVFVIIHFPTVGRCFPSLVQIDSEAVVGSTFTNVAFPTNVTAGNTIIVLKREGNASMPTDTVTDSLGNSYTAIVSTGASGICWFKAWYSSGIVGGTDAVNAAANASSNSQMIISEVSGLSGASFDVSATTVTSQNLITLTSPSVAISSNVEYLVGSGCSLNSANWTAGTGYVMQNCTAGSACRTFYEDRTVQSQGSYTMSTTGSTAQAFGVSLITFIAQTPPSFLSIEGSKVSFSGSQATIK